METLRELREVHQTQLFYDLVQRIEAPEPPSEVFELVSYPAPLGENAGYLSPRDEQTQSPAIVWIAGGFDWGIGDSAWARAPRENDQSARAFREAGIVLMLPSLRGSNQNPGRNECFFGEVEDVIAAGRFLAEQPGVDPDRVYLGGHSTGATLALLVAESTNQFRAIFAFAPAGNPAQYGPQGCMPNDASDAELAVRTPRSFIDEIESPTFLIAGTADPSARSVRRMFDLREQAPVRRVLASAVDHFTILAPGTEVVANKILNDTGSAAATGLRLTGGEILEQFHASMHREQTPTQQ